MDVKVTRSRDRALFQAMSDKGRDWMYANIGDWVIAVGIDYIEDLKEDMVKADLIVV